MIERFNNIDHALALSVAEGFTDLNVPDEVRKNHGQSSAFLSQITGKNQKFTAVGRKLGVLVMPGYDYAHVAELKTALTAAGVICQVGGENSSRSTHYIADLDVRPDHRPSQGTGQGRHWNVAQHAIHARDLPLDLL